jgi:hypothetical protein
MDLNGGNTTLKTVQETLAPNERFETPLDQLFGFSSAESIAGYVHFQTLSSAGVFGYLQSKTAGDGLTAVPAQESGYSNLLYSQSANRPGSYTGLTLMNAGPQSSSITIAAFDSQGASTGETTLTLAPNTRWSGLLSSLLPGTDGADGQIGGSVHITASAPILANQIWGSTSSAALAVMPGKSVQPSPLPVFIARDRGGIHADTVRISGVTPNQGPVGTIITITGLGFSLTASQDLVQFNKVGGGTILVPASTASTALLTVSVPSGAASGNVYVKVGSSKFLSLVFPTKVATSNGGVVFTVTSNNPVNTAPVIAAIPDQTVTLPSGVVVSTTVTDDGLPNGRLSGTWSVVSGPGTATFGTPTASTSGTTGQSVTLTVSTAVSFSAAGSYDIRLTASDGTLNSSSDAMITVNAPITRAVVNQPPVPNAGANQTITLPASAQLMGSATDDGLPNGTLTAAWTVINGPGTVTFADPSAFTTTATFPAAGIYTLQLTASDSQLSASSTTTVTVIAAPTGPVVSAGANQTITLPSSATLRGTATDPCLPNCTLSVKWNVISGPGTVTFGTPTALNTTATFSAAGTYTLQLQVSDGILSSSSTATVTVALCGVPVSGTVTLTANVTSGVGIAAVQFQLDGANLGSQLTTSPYSLTWNTTVTPNGCHVITAAAQDVNGNTGTSTANVFVNNP